MYYLQSRYYDPEVCRFINADAFASTGQGVLGYNMFAYCGNNPVCRADIGGMAWVDLKERVDGFFRSMFGREDLSVSENSTSYGFLIDYTVGTRRIQSSNSGSPSVFMLKSNNRIDNWFESSTSIEYNIINLPNKRLSLEVSIGLGNTGASISYTNDKTTSAVSVALNTVKGKVGVETSVTQNLGNGSYRSAFNSTSVSIWGLLALYKIMNGVSDFGEMPSAAPMPA